MSDTRIGIWDVYYRNFNPLVRQTGEGESNEDFVEMAYEELIEDIAEAVAKKLNEKS